MKIVISPSTVPSFNLAVEEYLFTRRGKSFFFLYRNDPSVIIGSNQAVVNEVNQDYCIEHDIRILRRISGGGAVYHDRGNLNYSLLQDKTDAPLSGRFLEPVVAVLQALSVPVEVGRRKDLWLEGYKISGTASHVSLNRELHHGTLLYDTDLDALQQALAVENERPVKKATASVPSPVTNIRSYLVDKGADAPGMNAFLEMFAAQLLLHYGESEIMELPAEALEAIGQLQKDKYTCRSWNYRL
ncbi:MAG: lipoate--protein ligase family protein [Proteiniphilum sp.]